MTLICSVQLAPINSLHDQALPSCFFRFHEVFGKMTTSDAGGDYSTQLLLVVVAALFIHFDNSVDQFLLLYYYTVCSNSLYQDLSFEEKRCYLLKDKRLHKRTTLILWQSGY